MARILTDVSRQREYAGRGGSTEARYGPIDEVAWYSENSDQKPHEVSQKRANGFGLVDMRGNVRQWVNKWFDQNYYKSSPPQDPSGPTNGKERVLRGGAYNNDPLHVRMLGRLRWNPGDRDSDNGFGFRCGGEVFSH